MCVQAAIDALICHCAPTFRVKNAAQFSQLPVSAMGSLLRKDNLDVTTELEVKRMICGCARALCMLPEIQETVLVHVFV